MSFFYTSAQLQQGEQIAWRRSCNHYMGYRAIGGQLTLTDRRLVFAPNRLDAVLGGRLWTKNLHVIEEVSSAPPESFPGGVRNLLRITTKHGDSLFLVNHLTEVIETVDSAIGRKVQPEQLPPPPLYAWSKLSLAHPVILLGVTGYFTYLTVADHNVVAACVAAVGIATMLWTAYTIFIGWRMRPPKQVLGRPPQQPS